MSLEGPKKLSHNTPQVGDVVLIKQNLPRGRWRVGVIRELIRGWSSHPESWYHQTGTYTEPSFILLNALELKLCSMKVILYPMTMMEKLGTVCLVISIIMRNEVLNT